MTNLTASSTGFTSSNWDLTPFGVQKPLAANAPISQASPTAPASDPQETYAGTKPAALTSQASVNAMKATHYQRDTLVNGMLDATGAGAPTSDEAAQMRAVVGTMDTGVLKLLGSNGVKIAVARPGADMNDMGVLQKKSLADYQSHMPEMQKTAEAYNQAGAPFDAKMDALRSQIDQLGPAGQVPFDGDLTQLTAAQKKAQELSSQIEDLGKQKLSAQGPVLRASDNVPVGLTGPLVPLNPPPGFGTQAVFMMDTPNSTAGMAQAAGAQTPEQIKEYSGLMEGINGQRLKDARADGLRILQQSVDEAKTPEDKQAAQAALEQGKTDPSQIVVDHKRFNLMTPDLFYRDNGKGGQDRLNRHDANGMLQWSEVDGGTKVNDPHANDQQQGGAASGDGGGAVPIYNFPQQPQSELLGEYYEDANKVMIRNTSISPQPHHSPTPTHELGHAVDHLVEQKDPAFYGPWKKQLDEAYNRVGGDNAAVGPEGPGADHNNNTISDYARTNPAEYIAEGVSNYYSDKKNLKTQDPELFRLTQQLLQHADAMGSAAAP